MAQLSNVQLFLPRFFLCCKRQNLEGIVEDEPRICSIKIMSRQHCRTVFLVPVTVEKMNVIIIEISIRGKQSLVKESAGFYSQVTDVYKIAIKYEGIGESNVQPRTH